MHLKKLIISGFKSFADKVTLNFGSGITGIVGPNGSGKSNVIDSVRWVMGEQNAKHLRGQVATDIIFAGSDKRKPLGMAEVTLVFDNTEPGAFCPPEYRHEPEISLTRRLYIDGEREYLINRKPCRLKDIVNFFAITGLGGRSYSMIQQGQVDRILNAKPEDVREILEEAAGTLVFKNRRASALKKLEMTNDNLSRVEDIITELSRQLEALKGQVEKAQKWKELSVELRREELHLFAHNYVHFNERFVELQSLLNSETDKEISFMGELAHLEARYEELQQILNEADPELEGLREEISIIREQIARSESTIASSNVVIESGQKRLTDLDRGIDEDTESLKSLEVQMQDASARLDEAQSAEESLRQLMDDFQNEVDSAEEAALVFQNRRDELDLQLKSVDRMLESNGLRCEAIERDRQRIVIELGQNGERIQSLKVDLGNLEKNAVETRAKTADKQTGLDQDIARKQQLEQAVAQRYEEIKVRGLRRDELREKFFTAKARSASMQEMEGGFEDTVAILKELRSSPEFDQNLTAGMLTDLISFEENFKTLNALVASGFERWAERIVVPRVEDLESLATWVQQKKMGGFPVVVAASADSAEVMAQRHQWAERHGMKPLRDFVRVQEETVDLTAVLSRLYFAEQDTLSIQAMSEMPRGVVLFTSRGLAVYEPHTFMVTGGSATKGILSRKNEIESLLQNIVQIEADLAELNDIIERLEVEQSSDRQAIADIDAVLKNLNHDHLAVLAELQAVTQQMEHKKDLLAEVEQRCRALEDSDRGFIRELEDLGQSRINLGLERENIVTSQDSLKDEAASVEDRREEIQRQFNQKKVDLAKSEARAQAIQENFAQTQKQMERLQQSLQRRYEEREKILADIEAATQATGECAGEIEGLIYRREAAEERLAEKREANAGVMEEMRVIEGRLKDARAKQAALQKLKSEKTIELERIKQVLAGVIEQAQEKYQTDIGTFEFTRDAQFDADQKHKEVQRLRSRIDNMGAINMVAIEEYERLSERYQFIEAQREEIFGSIQLLEEAISEIEETSREKFMAIFTVINQNFTELFPILFPGGEARLELTNPEDPLNAGVEIMVRLPGKKMQNMNLFSGGEKALTAISLIFALLKTKPTPFCFLDEVDAPLDEANVGRYNKVLEALSDRFQFIVITHNRRTMEVLDQLYGVTMQEAGVSKVVGVDMQKDLPDHLKKAFKEDKDKNEATPAGGRIVEGASRADF